MRKWTYAQIKAKVESDLDLQDETFIEPDEMLGYANEAIDEAEAEIHTLCEDYFRTKDTLTLVAGQAEYDLPTDIYALKLRAVKYNNGANRYTVTKISKQSDLETVDEVNSGDLFRYTINNSSADGFKQVFYPTPSSSNAGAYVTRWYIRNANRLVDDTDECDIPEFVSFIIAFMKEQCLAKERGGVAPPEAIRKTELQRKLMIETLTNMIPDGDNLIEADLSLYEEHA
jgi:hypothetical protein